MTLTKFEAQQLYLDLMKKSLSYSLWDDPGLPLLAYAHTMPVPMRWCARLITAALKPWKMQLLHGVGRDLGEDGRKWPGQAHTMIGLKRLDQLQECISDVIEQQIPGDLIEAGVWRGGASIFMRAVLKAHGVGDRRVFVADSFAGLPAPDSAYPQDRGDVHHQVSFLAVSQEQVEDNFRKYGLLDEQVVFLRGWFKDTLLDAPSDCFSVVRLDGDMYGSIMDGLVYLYPKLSPRGYCVIDDYGALESCQAAVRDYRREHSIEAPIHEIDWTGIYWRKS